MKQNKLVFFTKVLTHDTDGNGKLSTKSVQLKKLFKSNNLSQKCPGKNLYQLQEATKKK